MAKLTMYVIRKSYADVDSQLCAYINNLDNAIQDCPPGYKVYNAINGKVCYTNSNKSSNISKYEKMWNELYDYLETEIKYENFSNDKKIFAKVKSVMDKLKKRYSDE